MKCPRTLLKKSDIAEKIPRKLQASLCFQNPYRQQLDLLLRKLSELLRLHFGNDSREVWGWDDLFDRCTWLCRG
jgi:hypothetical protein